MGKRHATHVSYVKPSEDKLHQDLRHEANARISWSTYGSPIGVHSATAFQASLHDTLALAHSDGNRKCQGLPKVRSTCSLLVDSLAGSFTNSLADSLSKRVAGSLVDSFDSTVWFCYSFSNDRFRSRICRLFTLKSYVLGMVSKYLESNI